MKSDDQTGYGAAGDTIDYNYLVTNTGTTTETNISVSDNLVCGRDLPELDSGAGRLRDLHRQLTR